MAASLVVREGEEVSSTATAGASSIVGLPPRLGSRSKACGAVQAASPRPGLLLREQRLLQPPAFKGAAISMFDACRALPEDPPGPFLRRKILVR